MSRNGEWPTEDDTKRVERVMAEAMRDLSYGGREVTEAHAKALARVAARALSPSPDRLAEVREQTLREAEQAIQSEFRWAQQQSSWRDADVTVFQLCLSAVHALSSGTPTTEERNDG